MFHLFNKVYLEHDSRFHTKYNNTILAFAPNSHPMSKKLNVEFDQTPSFQEILDKKYEGDIEKFWASLLAIKEDHILFTDSMLFHQLQVQLWKSLFPHNNVEGLFELYKVFYNDFVLKNFLFSDNFTLPTDKLQMPYFFDDFANFESIYNSVEKSEVLARMDKGSVSFEYLLADYGFNPDSKYRDDFIARVEKLAWKSWFNDMESIKADIIGCFYDIHKLSPGKSVHGKSAHEILEMISADKNLCWITDVKFNANNIAYIKRNYPANLICDLAKKINAIWGYSFNQFKYPDEPIAFDQLLFTTLLFEEKYLEILNRDIKKGFGCFFVNDKIKDKANLLFSSYIYEKIRNNETNELKNYQLG